MNALGTHRAILVLLGAFAIYRAALLAAKDAGLDDLSGPIQLGWVALCIYTWVSPALFQRSLEKELEAVELDEDY
jgi:hypothetical protein